MRDADLMAEVESILESDLAVDAKRTRLLNLTLGEHDRMVLLLELLVTKTHVQARLLRRRSEEPR